MSQNTTPGLKKNRKPVLSWQIAADFIKIGSMWTIVCVRSSIREHLKRQVRSVFSSLGSLLWVSLYFIVKICEGQRKHYRFSPLS